MKVVIQRVKEASVSVNNKLFNEIKQGYLILVGFTHDDTIDDIDKIVKKIINLRVFADEEGKMNKNIIEVNGSILSISQFTLYANTKKGNRPSFVKAMAPTKALKLYNLFNRKLNKEVNTLPGIFGADMQISLINDGPVTIILDSQEMKK